jgi:hypothetical protein
MREIFNVRIKTPDSENFSRIVGTYEKRYGKLELVYRDVLAKFQVEELSNFKKNYLVRILTQYLFKWGRMARVLGFKGCETLGSKLIQMDSKLKNFKQENLSTIDLTKEAEKITATYDEIMNTRWKSNRGRIKRVGPTSTSKALHLVAPNLFMIWDRAIRNYYGFNDDGVEYTRFLMTMQSWLKELKPTIEGLQQKYDKSCTKIIDEYNWIKCRS